MNVRTGDQNQTAPELAVQWKTDSRWTGVERDYSTESVIGLQESEFASAADGYPASKHQREVGAGYFDRISTVLSPDSRTLAPVGSTESEQFH